MGATIDKDALKNSLFSMDETRREQVLKDFSDRFGQLFLELNQELALLIAREEWLLLHCFVEALELSMSQALEKWATHNQNNKKLN